MDPITSFDEADVALAQLQALKGHEARVNADCAKRKAAAMEAAKRRLVVDFSDDRDEKGLPKLFEADPADEAARPVEAWRAELTAALKEFSEAHREQICAEGKSLELSHGTLGWRMTRESIDVVDGAKYEDIETKLRDEVIQELNVELKRLTLKCGINAAEILDVDVTLSKTRLLQAVNSRAVKKAQLSRLKLRVVPSEDEFQAKPHTPNVVLTD